MAVNTKKPRVLLGITGSIAAYKACELARLLIQQEIRVCPVMTANATRFITPLTLAALTGFDMLPGTINSANIIAAIEHIELARWAQVIVVAPATANFIAKAAHGLADDLLTTILVAATNIPLLIAPAMNPQMFSHPTVAENIKRLKDRGVYVLGPIAGRAVCGEEGVGRMVESNEIIETIWSLLSPQDLCGIRILVTAGPTREYLDPVRFFSNPSSGRMGIEIARVACRRGAIVTLILGPTQLVPPNGVNIKYVNTAQEMYEAVMLEAPQARVIIKAAAVSDFSPIKNLPYKIKKNTHIQNCELAPTIDILAALGREKGSRILVGFAAETHNLLVHAAQKLISKNLDLIVANDISALNVGFASYNNKVTILDPAGGTEELPFMSKHNIASYLLDRIVRLLV